MHVYAHTCTHMCTRKHVCVYAHKQTHIYCICTYFPFGQSAAVGSLVTGPGAATSLWSLSPSATARLRGPPPRPPSAQHAACTAAQRGMKPRGREGCQGSCECHACFVCALGEFKSLGIHHACFSEFLPPSPMSHGREGLWSACHRKSLSPGQEQEVSADRALPWPGGLCWLQRDSRGGRGGVGVAAGRLQPLWAVSRR